VRIIENADYRWPEGEGWRFSEAPTVDIGASQSETEQLFNVVDALKLDDGRIVVANSGSGELRFYDAAGAFLNTSGRKGDGPGEFGELLWMRTHGDSLLAFDWDGAKLSVFGLDGTFARSVAMRPLIQTGGAPSYLSPFADGTLLAVASLYRSESGGLEAGMRRNTALHLRCDMDGGLIDTVGALPGDEWYLRSEGGGVVGGVRALGLEGHTTAHSDGFFYGDSESYEIGDYDRDGTLTRLIRLDRPNRPVTDRDIELYEEDQVEEWGGDPVARQAIQRMLIDMPFPETLPAYGEFRVDEEGNLWVSDYRRPGEKATRWTVFDPSGAALGVVEMPPRFTPYQIGSDFVLGRWQDELDVEHVRVYGLLKG
jgi:hypothetical protein